MIALLAIPYIIDMSLRGLHYDRMAGRMVTALWVIVTF